MSKQLQALTCQRCGSGFVLCDTYRDMLERRGKKVTLPPQCPTCFLTRGPQPKLCGQVKWFSENKHYGFIAAEDGQEVFFHERSLVSKDGGGPKKGNRARFHVRSSAKGPEALNVELAAQE